MRQVGKGGRIGQAAGFPLQFQCRLARYRSRRRDPRGREAGTCSKWVGAATPAPSCPVGVESRMPASSGARRPAELGARLREKLARSANRVQHAARRFSALHDDRMKSERVRDETRLHGRGRSRACGTAGPRFGFRPRLQHGLPVTHGARAAAGGLPYREPVPNQVRFPGRATGSGAGANGLRGGIGGSGQPSAYRFRRRRMPAIHRS